MHLPSIYVEHARTINLILLIACIAAMTANMFIRWVAMTRRTRRVLSWIYVIFLNLVYGYTIVMKEHRPFNPSVLVGTILFSGLLVALIWKPENDDQMFLADNSLGSRFVKWLDRRVRMYKARHYNKRG